MKINIKILRVLRLVRRSLGKVGSFSVVGLIAFSAVTIFASQHSYYDKYYLLDLEYIGYPSTWGSSEVSYMFAANPEANMEAGPFIRPCSA